MAMELEAVRRLVQERGSDLAFVVNHSGGKDSTRMLGFVRNKFRDSPTYVVMADTGFEHQRPISAADFARQRCAEFGLNLTVVRNPKRTYLEMVERRGMFPSPKFRQCTSDLKRSPIEKFIRTLPHKMIVNCIGIRAEESHSRSRLAPLAVNASLTTRRSNGLQLASDLRPVAGGCTRLALGERRQASSGVRPRVSQGRNDGRLPAPVFLQGVHLFDGRRPSGHLRE